MSWNCAYLKSFYAPSFISTDGIVDFPTTSTPGAMVALSRFAPKHGFIVRLALAYCLADCSVRWTYLLR